MNKSVYIAGPMRHRPQFNFPAFYAAEAELSRAGYVVHNPARHDAESLGLDCKKFPTGDFKDAGWSDEQINYFMREAFAWDMQCVCEADAIALLPGWEQSAGVAVELAVANLLKLEVIQL